MLQFALIIITLSLTACGSSTSRYQFKSDSAPMIQFNANKIPNAIPRHEAKSRYGNKNYQVNGQWYQVKQSAQGYKEQGIASWYGKRFHGHLTSNHERYNMFAMSAAHKTLPLPTYLKVTNLNNHKQIIVRVNDRGPFHANRIIDLSYAAAKKLALTKHGTAYVQLEAITSSPTHVNNTYTQPLRSKYLQAGAFNNLKYAQNLQNALKKIIHKAPINIQVKAHQSPKYRVIIGPIGHWAHYHRIKSQLQRLLKTINT